MINNKLKTIFSILYFAFCGLLVGFLISYISPTGSSQNAPIKCMFGAMSGFVFLKYVFPYYRKQKQMK
jgi:hypothetical protein